MRCWTPLIALSLPLAAWAQVGPGAPGPTGWFVGGDAGFGVIEAEPAIVLALSGGYRLQALYAGVRLPEAAISPNGSGRYYGDASDGVSACRDRETGAAVSGAYCVLALLSASAEGGVRVGRVSVGAGYRRGNASGPYGVASWGSGWDSPTAWLIRVEGGPHHIAATIGLRRLF